MIAPGPFPPQWQAGGAAGTEGPSYSISIAVAVLSVATFGLALQFFLLVAPRRGTTLLGLFVFTAWLLPAALGAIFGAAGVSPQFAMAVAATSPLAGIAMSTDIGPPAKGSDLVRLAALVPALVFALLFNNGVTWARRRRRRHPRRPRPQARGRARPPGRLTRRSDSTTGDSPMTTASRMALGPRRRIASAAGHAPGVARTGASTTS